MTLTVLHNDANLGFAGGVNRGIRHAMDFGFDGIAMFNNDAVADRHWLRHLVAELDGHPERIDRHRPAADGRRRHRRQHR